MPHTCKALHRPGSLLACCSRSWSAQTSQQARVVSCPSVYKHGARGFGCAQGPCTGASGCPCETAAAQTAALEAVLLAATKAPPPPALLCRCSGRRHAAAAPCPAPCLAAVAQGVHSRGPQPDVAECPAVGGAHSRQPRRCAGRLITMMPLPWSGACPARLPDRQTNPCASRA